jgi:hypothetical protein
MLNKEKSCKTRKPAICWYQNEEKPSIFLESLDFHEFHRFTFTLESIIPFRYEKPFFDCYHFWQKCHLTIIFFFDTGIMRLWVKKLLCTTCRQVNFIFFQKLVVKKWLKVNSKKRKSFELGNVYFSEREVSSYLHVIQSGIFISSKKADTYGEPNIRLYQIWDITLK